ncbi:hypothetical protein FEF65_02545 [Mariprofundus erugo]|uniref:YhdP central domain-containing protein n=2 Tax=Mariprofundus erugo TaxID=2528639 RepID=A0A5R9H0T3_9PROT|nr:hypothetical protein FEF65_02545 [Mariprofundus erugo]
MSGTAEMMKRALASCRRVFLLVTLILSMFAGWLYWQAPGLNSIRPDIEHFLQQQLDLKELQLGQLSWYWAGSLWIQAEHLDFTSRDETLAYHNGHAAIRVALTDLLSGEVSPDSIRLSGGRLDLVYTNTATALPASLLVLDNVELAWSSGQWRGSIPHVQLTMNGSTRSLDLFAPSVKLSGQLDRDGLPHRLELHCNQLDWLPAELRERIQGGAPEGTITLQRTGPRSWQTELAMASSATTVIIPADGYHYPLNHLEAGLNIITTEADAMAPASIEIGRLHWSLGDNSIMATGNWKQGKLTLQAESSQLAMPLIWSWMEGAGDEEWRHWLTLMHSGHAHKASAQMTLQWEHPFTGWPTDSAIDAMRYHVHADIEDADIALGISTDALAHTRGQVDLDQDGMHASIITTELPGSLGHSSGDLYIPWDTLLLQVSGRVNADVEGLLHWFQPDAAAGWQWHGSRAEGNFSFLWDTSESEPREANALLKPSGTWLVSMNNQEFTLTGGEMLWNKSSGIELHDVNIAGKYLNASLSLSATPPAREAVSPPPATERAPSEGTDSNSEQSNKPQWQLKTLDAQLQGPMGPLLTSFQVPVSNVDGSLRSELHYNGQWSGSVDMQDASWEHLLGSEKKMGEPFSLNYQGQLNLSGETPSIELSQLQSQGNAIKLHGGSVSINRQRMKAQLKELHTASFSGSLDIVVPFDDKPWQANMHATFLNRNALPNTLDHPEQMTDKRWVLHALIDHFDWEEASMTGVKLDLSSEQGSIGKVEAATVHTSQIEIRDIEARFTLPGQGRVELRKFVAAVEKQHLMMSATLSPETDGGMRWSGFAELEGDFGHLIKLGGLSERFLGGKGHLLFSGQGLILKEQPWWQGLDGRLRMRVDDGRILEGGTLTTLLAVINLSKLPALLLGKRDDLSGPGIKYDRLQMEAIIQNQDIHIRNVAMRSTAFDLIGHGAMDIDQASIDLYLVARPLQNLDAVLAKVPLLRDLIGGASHSLMRKVYHMVGPFTNATVEEVKPEQAGMASPGLIERMLAIPNDWFGSDKPLQQP